MIASILTYGCAMKDDGGGTLTREEARQKRSSELTTFGVSVGIPYAQLDPSEAYSCQYLVLKSAASADRPAMALKWIADALLFSEFTAEGVVEDVARQMDNYAEPVSEVL